VGRLAPLDPTTCFAGLNLTYRLRVVPLFVRPSADRVRAFMRWETGGAPIDPAWLEVTALTAEVPRPKIVWPRKPARERLPNLRIPTLVLVAENSRSHDPAPVAANARRFLSEVVTAILPGATHHTIPMLAAAELNARLGRLFP